MKFQNSNTKIAQILITFLTVVFFTISGFFVGSVFFPNSSSIHSVSSLQTSAQDLAKYNSVLSTLENQFYYRDRLLPSKLQDSTIKGLVAGLNDTPTRYLNTEEYTQYKQTIAGNISGIGIEIGAADNGSKIVSVYQDTPADKAGLKKDDLFLKIDNIDVSKLSAGEVASYVRGQEGSKVTLIISRNGSEQTFQITRAKIYTKSIIFKKITPENFQGICDFTISRFTDDTVQKWDDNWNDAVSQFKSNNCKKLIIDLRNNGGGYVAASEYAIEEFIQDGKVIYGQKQSSGTITNIISNRDSNIKDTTNYPDYRIGALRDTPVVVLINSSSASASEIFAGSLQNLNRAKLVGTPSYGKGSEQQTQEFSDGSALIYTSANWTLPNGQVIDQNYPIKPDYEVLLDDSIKVSTSDKQLDKAKEILGK